MLSLSWWNYDRRYALSSEVIVTITGWGFLQATPAFMRHDRRYTLNAEAIFTSQQDHLSGVRPLWMTSWWKVHAKADHHTSLLAEYFSTLKVNSNPRTMLNDARLDPRSRLEIHLLDCSPTAGWRNAFSKIDSIQNPVHLENTDLSLRNILSRTRHCYILPTQTTVRANEERYTAQGTLLGKSPKASISSNSIHTLSHALKQYQSWDS